MWIVGRVGAKNENALIKQFQLDRSNTEEKAGCEPEKTKRAGLLKAKSLPATLIEQSKCILVQHFWTLISTVG